MDCIFLPSDLGLTPQGSLTEKCKAWSPEAREAAAAARRGNNVSERIKDMVAGVKGASELTRERIGLALESGFKSFKEIHLSDDEKEIIDSYSTGDIRIAGRQLVDISQKCFVLNSVIVYRAAKNDSLRPELVTSFSLRKEWVESYAKDSDLKVIPLRLNRGDKALFVPFYNERHLAEVEVLIPPDFNK